MCKRIFDILVSIFLILVLSPVMFIVAIAIKLSSTGEVLYVSDRIGLNKKIIRMPKFRTMYSGTPEVATHLLKNPIKAIMPLGVFLRKFSVDELPQLFSVLKGDMSLVGPRPALYNQHDLIEKRFELGIYNVKPGITGWAQVNGRDKISMTEKIEMDLQYVGGMSLFMDCKILLLTLSRSAITDSVTH